MVSALDRCKRALVVLIRTLSGLYGCSVTVTQDSSDASVRTAYRKLSKKVHPDRGGSAADQRIRDSCAANLEKHALFCLCYQTYSNNFTSLP